jgi:hypothetical protein
LFVNDDPEPYGSGVHHQRRGPYYGESVLLLLHVFPQSRHE